MGLEQENLLANNQFRVAIGPLLYSFAGVENISSSMTYEAYQEGGFNSYPKLLRAPKAERERLVLKRGVRIGLNDAPAMLLTTGVWLTGVVIMVMKHNKVAKSYFFEEGVITKWDVGSLNATDKSLLIRSVEIMHSGLHESVL